MWSITVSPAVYPSGRIIEPVGTPLAAEVGDIRFTTQIPGGFGEASFTLCAPAVEAFRWYSRYLGAHLEIFCGGIKVWEGLVWDAQLNPLAGRHMIGGQGYWATLAKRCYLTHSTSANTISSIIATLAADCPWLAGSRIVTINRKAPQYFDLNYSIQDWIMKLLEGGDGGNPPTLYDPAIWEGRILQVQARATPAQYNTWRVKLGAIEHMALESSLGGVWNKVAVRWTGPLAAGLDASDATVWYEDTKSQGDWGVHSTVLHVSDILSADVAPVARHFLARHSAPAKSGEIIVGGVDGVTRADGYRPVTLGEIRAGQFISLDDLVPRGEIQRDVADELQLLFIAETEFDATSGRLTVRPQLPGATLENLLAAAAWRLERQL